jgi:hypothetical protein
MRWVYTDCRGGTRKPLLEVEAEDIQEADKLLEENLGIKPAKQPLITVHSPDWMI